MPAPDNHDIPPVDPLPTSGNPLSPGRTDVHPSREAGVEELPDDHDQRPVEGDDTQLDPRPTDQETDNAEFDDQPNPR
ncbi:hypothetical protein [Pseudomonas fulva]|nr:hypothetical protein [Pseudomonas fulva]MBF8779365.1 hypothetical protein [Pseudomonas fulva]